MIVVDSSVLIAFHNQSDVFHRGAKSALETLAAGAWGKAILLEYVFVETTNVLKRRSSARAAIEAGVFIRRSHQFDFLPCSDLWALVFREFNSDYQTPLGFVDHAIALVARQRAGGKVLTFDKAFRQVPGITVLPE